MSKKALELIRLMTSHLSDPKIISSDVISNGAPVISFGDYSKSKIATLGLNPSNKEFYDSRGSELEGCLRRFHTLNSLGVDHWKNIKDEELHKILTTCQNYFYLNPYDRWFRPLDYIISGTGHSYYDSFTSASHLDLVPYATNTKWGDLSKEKKSYLLKIGSKYLAKTLNMSAIEVIILNGKSVVVELEKVADIKFKKREVFSWNLPRKKGFVRGESYTGEMLSLGGERLKKPIQIFGFNHNIQSSFGVTNEVKKSIKNWIARRVDLK